MLMYKFQIYLDFRTEIKKLFSVTFLPRIVSGSK